MTRLLRRLRYLLHRDRHERELDDELQFHLEMKRQDLESRGLERAAAAVAARRALGNLPLTRDHVRDVWIAPWLQSVVQDIRYGLRTLRRHPGFAALAIATLSLGIGASTATFSIADAVLMRPLPVHEQRKPVGALGRRPGRRGGARAGPLRCVQGIRGLAEDALRRRRGRLSRRGHPSRPRARGGREPQGRVGHRESVRRARCHAPARPQYPGGR